MALINAIAALDARQGRGRRPDRRQHPAPRAGGAAAQHRRATPARTARSSIEMVRRAQKEQKNTNVGYDVLADEYVDMLEAGHHRPGQGDPLGGRERGLDRRHDPDHRGADHRQAGGEVPRRCRRRCTGGMDY